jgi:hypothetical protein
LQARDRRGISGRADIVELARTEWLVALRQPSCGAHNVEHAARSDGAIEQWRADLLAGVRQ